MEHLNKNKEIVCTRKYIIVYGCISEAVLTDFWKYLRQWYQTYTYTNNTKINKGKPYWSLHVLFVNYQKID